MTAAFDPPVTRPPGAPARVDARLMKVCWQNPRRVGSLFEAVFACALRLRVLLSLLDRAL